MESSNDVLEQVQKLRDEKEKAETQLGQVQEMNLRYKEQSDRVQQSVTEKMGSIIQVRARRSSFVARHTRVRICPYPTYNIVTAIESTRRCCQPSLVPLAPLWLSAVLYGCSTVLYDCSTV